MATTFQTTIHLQGEAVLTRLDELTTALQLDEDDLEQVRGSDVHSLHYKESAIVPRATESLHVSIDRLKVVNPGNIAFVPYTRITQFVTEKMAKQAAFAVLAYSRTSTDATPIYFSGKTLHVMNATDNFSGEIAPISDELSKTFAGRIQFSSPSRIATSTAKRLEGFCLLINALSSSIQNPEEDLMQRAIDEPPRFRVPAAWAPFAHHTEALDCSELDVELANGANARVYRQIHIREQSTVRTLTNGSIVWSIKGKEMRNYNTGLHTEARRIRELAEARLRQQRTKRIVTGVAVAAVVVGVVLHYIFQDSAPM